MLKIILHRRTFEKRLNNNIGRVLNIYIKQLSGESHCIEEKMAPKLAPTVKLNNGYDMPMLGLGTYQLKGPNCEQVVKKAIDLGYRHFDTALVYRNEKAIGNAIREKIQDGVVKREDVFIVTKLWNTYHDKDLVETVCCQQNEALGLGYIDLYLMHFPVGYKYQDDNTFVPKDADGSILLTDDDYVDTYSSMEKCVESGMVRSLGLSNFNSVQVQRILNCCKIRPVVNQVEVTPSLNQRKLTKFCMEHEIFVIGYRPLGHPNPDRNLPAVNYSDKLQILADTHKKTPSQIILRYLVELGVIPIPKSSHSTHLAENIDIFDFQLTKNEIEVMDCYHNGTRSISYTDIKKQNHKYYPFDIEF